MSVPSDIADQVTTGGATRQVVGFHLGDEQYGIEITKIQEIILVGEITRIPHVPVYIEGLINLRGSVIPIIDLRKRFGIEARAMTDDTRIIVVNVRNKTIGTIVDAVNEVIRISHEQIDPAPPTITSMGREHIAGLAKLDQRLLILLEIEKVLDQDSLEQVELTAK
ncbi:Chemotaxis protein CheW [Planctomycetes bacterium Pan216]|uniref:Chemotaxis protein CheW n=1 Tax=Kolteria novifilia TaxID=2527975 RepID=A0A518BCN9_9BACT|nr:Chemotaxis protein CheW [Planctomycetes bacterium Pan216]